MKRVKLLILGLILSLLVGCGENSQSTNTTTPQGIQLNVTLDNSVQKNNPNQFEKQSNIDKMILEVKDKNSISIYNKALTKTGTKWSAKLNLNQNNAPFTFIATAYDINSKAIYSGTTTISNINTSRDINISIAPIDLTVSVQPFIDSHTKNFTAQGVDFNFTVVNYQKDNLHYTVQPLDINNSICSNPFTPNSGTLTFSTTQTVLSTQWVFDTNSSCQTQRFSVVLKSNNNDSVTTIFKLDNNNNISINLPPDINYIDITEDNSSIDLKVNATDSDGPAPLLYSWALKEGNVSILGQSNLETLQLTGYSGSGRIVLDLNVSDSGGAMSHISYILHGNYSTTALHKTIQTGQKSTYRAFDDGYYKKGKDRNFTRDTTTATVTDFTQNLMWEDNITLTTRILNWNDANNTCKTMSLGGYNDWRLPTIQELVNLSDKSKYQPALPIEFTYNGLQNANSRNAEAWYWSSTTEYYNPTNKAWIMFEDTGHITWSATANTQYVRCVRDIN